jgi:hypothetical protein
MRCIIWRTKNLSAHKWMRCAIAITALYKLVSALGKFSAFVFVSQPIAINNAQIESWPPPAPQITHNRTENLAQANRVFAPLRFRTVSPPPPTEREKQLATHSRRSLIMCFYYTNFNARASRLSAVPSGLLNRTLMHGVHAAASVK